MEQIAAVKVSVGAVFICLALSTSALFGTRMSMLEAAPRGGAVEREVSAGRNVNGLLQSSAQPDNLGLDHAEAVKEIIQRADQAAEKLDAIADDLRHASDIADPRAQELLKNLDEASADAKDLIATAKRELQ